MDDIIIRCVPLPYCIKGLVSDNPDGYHNVFINSNYSIEMQQEILQHELRHIKNDDFFNFDEIEKIEQRAKTR